MPVMSLTLLVLAVLLLLIGVPVAVALGFSSVIVMAIYHPVPSMQIIPQLFSEASTSFVMLAVPLFILVGNLMEKGSVGKNLINMTSALVGWQTGGLGAVNIVGSMIFGGISGSSLADTATFGTILVPRMKEDGYPEDYAAAITSTSSTLSVIIPPSILLVLAAAATQQSVAKALVGGLIPGVLVTIALIIPNYIICKKNHFGTIVKFSAKNVWKTFKMCWSAFFAPIIVLVSIFSGVVTPTEGAAIAILYILLIDGVIYRRLTFQGIWDSLKNTAKLTSAILFIATSSAITNFIIAFEGVPDHMANVMLGMRGGTTGFLLIAIVFLVIVGMFMDASPAILIFAPLLMPIAVKAGIDPIHFIVVMVLTFALGLTTPPYGVCLFSVASVCKVPMDRLIKRSLPFYLCILLVVFLVAFIPEISLFFPNLLGI